MGLFRRARSEREQIDRIHTLAAEVYARHGMSGELVPDLDDPVNASIMTERSTFGLANATIACLQAPERQWRSVLERFAASMQAAENAAGPDLDRDRANLRARLLAADALVQGMFGYARPYAPGLVEVLCLDSPQSVATVSDGSLAGRDDVDDLFATGRAQLALEPIDRREVLDDGVTVLDGGSLFIASMVLTPERIAVELGGAPNGFVFVIPDRQTILAHAMDGANSVTALQRLAGIGAGIAAEQRPGGLLSRAVYYAHGDHVQQVTELDPETGAIRILADGPFFDALNR